jgi:hypothetical protein
VAIEGWVAKFVARQVVTASSLGSNPVAKFIVHGWVI